MSDATDILVPISRLTLLSDGLYEIGPDLIANMHQINLLLNSVIEQYVEARTAPAPTNLVSATLDVAGQFEAGVPVQFVPQIERRTRTLVFASGLARQATKPLLQATLVFRTD